MKLTHVPMTHSSLSIITFLICLVAVIALIANTSVLIVFFKYQQLRRKPSNYFAVNLALSDICIIIGPMSLWILNMWHNYTAFAFRKGLIIPIATLTSYNRAWHTLDAVLMNVSIANLAMLSLERYIALARPIWHRLQMSKRRTKIACLIPWLYALVVLTPLVAHKHNDFGRFIHKATPTVISCMVILISYVMLLYSVFTKTPSPSHSNKIGKFKREVKLTLRLSLLTVAFLACWLPVTIWAFWLSNPVNFAEVTLTSYLNVSLLLKFLSYFNSFLNPFLYVFGRPAFARILKSTVCCSLQSVTGIFTPTPSTVSKSRGRTASAISLYSNAETMV